MAFFQIISGAIPSTLGQVVTFQFDLFSNPPDNIPLSEGILLYMIDTRNGERTYKVQLNGSFENTIALPKGNFLATLNTPVTHLEPGRNVLTFESIAGNQPLNILNVAVLYELSVLG